MNEVEDQRIALAVNRVQTGLRVDPVRDSRTQAIVLAEQLAPIEFNASTFDQLGSESVFDSTDLNVSVDTVRRLRKLTEIVEDELGVDVGHSRFVRAATALSSLSSLGSILIAGQNLTRVSATLLDEYEKTGSTAAVDEKHYTAFYQALCILVIDCMLFSTPLNYKAAWLGTRFINNRFLYLLRRISPQLHRYAMSELHYVIREVPPKILKGSLYYADYIVSVAVSTFEVIWEFEQEKIGIVGVPGLVSDLVDEFDHFVQWGYDISPPEVDWEAIYTNILREANKSVSEPFWSAEEILGHANSVKR